MNWDNQNNNKDPWGRNNNDGPDFDDLIKRFSMIFGLVLLLSLLMFTTFNDLSRLVLFLKF